MKISMDLEVLIALGTCSCCCNVEVGVRPIFFSPFKNDVKDNPTRFTQLFKRKLENDTKIVYL